MVTINLLPWPEYIRVYQAARIKKLLLGAAVAAFSMVLCMHFYMSRQLHAKQNEIAKLEEEIDKFSNVEPFFSPKNADLNAGKDRESREINHKKTQKLFTELGKMIIGKVCFTEIVREKNTIIFSGRAETAADFTLFLTHWKAASLFSEIKIEQLQYQPAHQQMHFRFQAT